VTPAQMLEAFNHSTANAPSSTARGDALANYVSDIFSQVTGITVYDSKVFSDDRSQELDVILWNEQDGSDSGIDFLPNIILVEAKNWDHPVGAAEVAWFKEKIRQGGDYSGTGAVGILIAPHGVTGQKHDRDFAAAVILRARSENVRILVAAPDELSLDAKQLRALIKNRLCALAAGHAGLG
jgi:hypothetical protein